MLARLRIPVAVAAILLVAGCGSSGPPGAPGTAVGTDLGRHPLAADIKTMPLKTSEGSATSLGAYAGKIVVVSDSMSLCQESCPLTTANVVAAARAVDKAGLGNKVVFLTITVDPNRDSVARLAAYRKFFAKPGQLPNWQLLTGAPSDIDALWKYFGVYWKKVKQDNPAEAIDWMTGRKLTYDIVHSDDVYFIDPSQDERFLIDGMAMTSKGTVPSALKSFMNGEGMQNMHHPGAGAWTVDEVLQTVSWLAGKQIQAS